MTLQDVVDRARSAIGRGIRYKLGTGGFHPDDDTPSRSGVCDCSGFVAWCLRMSRRIAPDSPWYEYYREYNGGWVETSALVRDAEAPFGFVDRVAWEDAEPGMLLVYGDSKGRSGETHQGHVGIVSAINGRGPEMAIHCSRGNDTSFGDAIHETGIKLWVSRGIVCRVAGVEGVA